MSPAPQLARRLGLVDATVIGLGSMLGAGVFVVFAPASAAAGDWLLVGLAIAAFVAFCNATSTAQLAARYPESGGAYVYGRARLGAWPGFLAGWCFVIGKTASCAAMALAAAAYLVPDAAVRPVAVALVVGCAVLNGFGVTRTARATAVVVVVAVAALAAVVTAGAATGQTASHPLRLDAAPGGALGVLQSAGLLFFAFAGYARIATMGAEVRRPAVTIPRAVVAAFVLALGVYVAVAVTLLGTLGALDLAASTTPVVDAAVASGVAGTAELVRVAAPLAATGALLALVAGIGRTALAMAGEGDLPRPLAAVHPRHHVPRRAEYAVAAVVCVLVLTVDLRDAVGFSSFGVLLYYAVANASALTQPRDERRWPRALAALGLAGCVVLVATLPLGAVLTGLGVVAAGVLWRLATRRPASGARQTR